MAQKFRLDRRNYKRLGLKVSKKSQFSSSLILEEQRRTKRKVITALLSAGILSIATAALVLYPFSQNSGANNGLNVIALADAPSEKISNVGLSQQAGYSVAEPIIKSYAPPTLSQNIDSFKQTVLAEPNSVKSASHLGQAGSNNKSFFAEKQGNKNSLLNLTADVTIKESEWLAITVEKGDTLSGLFTRLDLPQRDWRSVLKLEGPTKKLTRLRPGEVIEVIIGYNFETDENQLNGIRYQYEKTKSFEAIRASKAGYSLKDFVLYDVEHPLEIREVFAEGTINNSLSRDANEAGVPMSVVAKIADIFAWDIDFALDIQPGDQFSVVYEEVWVKGELSHTRNVLATQFVNRKNKHEAVYFEHEDGFKGHFTPKGRSLKKAFLRSPLKFSRVSSPFNLKRKHPILNKIRAHKGVDYAAASGTPINAAGSGKIKFAGWKKGYGRTLVIKHPGGIETLYAHLKGFARKFKVGERVTQGELVAYVGSTGLATGPHLHYEFRQHGRHRDPLSVELPRSIPMPEEYKSAFALNSKRLIARLRNLGGQSPQQEISAPQD